MGRITLRLTLTPASISRATQAAGIPTPTQRQARRTARAAVSTASHRVGQPRAKGDALARRFIEGPANSTSRVMLGAIRVEGRVRGDRSSVTRQGATSRGAYDDSPELRAQARAARTSGAQAALSHWLNGELGNVCVAFHNSLTRLAVRPGGGQATGVGCPRHPTTLHNIGGIALMDEAFTPIGELLGDIRCEAASTPSFRAR